MGIAAGRRSTVLVLALVAAAPTGCRQSRKSGEPEGGTGKPTSGPATTTAAPTAGEPATRAPVRIPWMSDDWPGALARARREKKPIFIDLWAPWCHTCLSMKQIVMVDPSLAPYLDRFVWLEIDTDRPVNAELLTRLEVSVWPTFYVLSPTDEAVQARHLGAASVAQLREVLAQGEAGHQDAMASAGALDPRSPVGLVRAGDRAAAASDHGKAAASYAAALAAAPPEWPRTADLLVKQIAAVARSGDQAGCAELGMRESQRAALGKTASVTDFAYYAGQCAEVLDEPQARQLRQRLAGAIRVVLDAPDSAMSLDDRSDALMRLREMAETMGDPELARAEAVRQRDLLERAATEAPTAAERMTYNWQRAEVHVYLGEGAVVIPALEKSAAELPKEYDPPFRLAWVHLKIGKPDEALRWAEQALPLVYGPRKGRLLVMVAEIHKARGDVTGELAARRAVVDHYAALPAGQKNEKAQAEAVEALAQARKAGVKPAK